MAEILIMPRLTDTMEEGVVASILVKEGDTIKSGDLLAEIETDKATMEVEAVDEGVVAKILVAEGSEGVKVNAVIAVLAEEGEDASDIDSASSAAPAKEATSDDSDVAKSGKAPAAAKPDAAAPIRAPNVLLLKLNSLSLILRLARSVALIRRYIKHLRTLGNFNRARLAVNHTWFRACIILWLVRAIIRIEIGRIWHFY